MKYRILGITAAVIMLIVVSFASVQSFSDNHRVQQHFVSRSYDNNCDCTGSDLCTHLPIVLINTDGKDIPGDVKSSYTNRSDKYTFVDYFIISEFTMNYDSDRFSTYFYKDYGGVFTPVVWDFNSAFDNYAETATGHKGFITTDKLWFYMLVKDDYFTDCIINRYRELRKGILSDEYLDKYIDDTLEYLGDAADRNFEVWGYTFDMDLLDPPERNITSHKAAVSQMKSFIKSRNKWLDENIESLKSYSHSSITKRFNGA